MGKESKFREDKNLAFLQDAEWQDLKILAEALIKDHHGTEQWTGELKSTIEKNKELYPSDEELYKKSWKAIAAELQLFGGDTIANLVRRNGVLYEVILDDVVKKVKCDIHQRTSSIEEIEEKLLRTLFGRLIDINDLDYMYSKLEEMGLLGLTSLKSKPLDTIKGSFSNRSKLATLGLVARKIPIVSIATAPLAIKELSDPAYRVTIPAVCIVAILRRKHIKNGQVTNEF